MTSTTPEGSTLTKRQQAEQDRDDARATLRRYFPEGSTVAVMQTHRSASGMTRHVVVLAVSTETRPGYDARPVLNVSHVVARACGMTRARGDHRNAIAVGGCGFSATDDVVQTLARALYGNPYALNTGEVHA